MIVILFKELIIVLLIVKLRDIFVVNGVVIIFVMVSVDFVMFIEDFIIVEIFIFCFCFFNLLMILLYRIFKVMLYFIYIFSVNFVVVSVDLVRFVL